MSKSKTTFILFLLSFLFVIFSFGPSIVEITKKNNLPPWREFVLEHNYMFDYNFYLSRIRQGQEGKFTVVEKYYSEPHQGSLIQVVYLWAGKVGGIFHLDPPTIYHLMRLVFGFLFLFSVGYFVQTFFTGWWAILAFLFIVTAGSYPIPIWFAGFPRFGTYMGWWSVVDSLQRITFIPHILMGQLAFLWFVIIFSKKQKASIQGWVGWGITGFVSGIIFPPVLIMAYAFFFVISLVEFVYLLITHAQERKERTLHWLYENVSHRIIFTLLSFPSLVYFNLMFKVMPWSALALFDIQHRMGIPYAEYYNALGIMLPLGFIGAFIAIVKMDKKYFSVVSWIAMIFLLFRIFENVPEQSPLRFTEGAIHIPLGILATLLCMSIVHFLKSKKNAVSKTLLVTTYGLITFIIIIGIGVMLSSLAWLSDQVKWKQLASWPVPIGAQLAYPLKDFMQGVYFIRDHTNKNSVILGYITAGNFIPAYAGQYTYIGHANTPDEDGKEKIAAQFFKGEMGTSGMKFLKDNHVSYVFFGPQEKEIGLLQDLQSAYPYLTPIYANTSVVIYSVP